jgi:hypothetical protein
MQKLKRVLLLSIIAAVSVIAISYTPTAQAGWFGCVSDGCVYYEGYIYCADGGKIRDIVCYSDITGCAQEINPEFCIWWLSQ